MSPRLLPLFPLPLVLLPGAVMPLHVFEPRYRALLRDCLVAERAFGLPYLPPDVAESLLPAGHVGCVAHVEHVEALDDGRANIVVRGGERFALLALEPSVAPYHVGRVVTVQDEPEEAAALAVLAERVRDGFTRVARAARTIADEHADLPALPPEPAALAFAIGNLIDLGATDRQRLLASRSPGGRLRQIAAVLDVALPRLEERAQVHARAAGNGAGPQAHAP